jgi:cobalt/nickel transport system ATP-binding protein
MEPDLIVCDEPAANLDPFFANVIFNNLEVLNKKGKTILISTHDVNQAYSWADYVVILNKGEVLDCGLPEIIFNKKEVLSAAHLNQPFIIDVLNNLEFNFEGNLLPKNINDLKKILNNNFNSKE